MPIVKIDSSSVVFDNISIFEKIFTGFTKIFEFVNVLFCKRIFFELVDNPELLNLESLISKLLVCSSGDKSEYFIFTSLNSEFIIDKFPPLISM